MYGYDEGFRYDLKYKAVNAFEDVNPHIFAITCTDPAAMEKISTLDRELDQEKAEFDAAAHASKPYRIASETLAIVDERMKVNQTPRPPSWADNGRGGILDPRTIFEQARMRINLSDQSYQNQIEEFRVSQREEIARESHSKQTEEGMTAADNPMEQLKADLMGIVQKSHETRTQLNVWYIQNKDALLETERNNGSNDPALSVKEAQQERVMATIGDAQDLVGQRIDDYQQSLSNAFNGNTINGQQTQQENSNPIPEPPSMKNSMAQEPEQSNEHAMPNRDNQIMNGSIEH